MYIQSHQKLHIRKALLLTLSSLFIIHFVTLFVYDTKPNPNYPPVILANRLKTISHFILSLISSYLLSVKPNKFLSVPIDAVTLIKSLTIPQKLLFTRLKALNVTNQARRNLGLNNNIEISNTSRNIDDHTKTLIENEANQLVNAFDL